MLCDVHHNFAFFIFLAHFHVSYFHPDAAPHSARCCGVLPPHPDPTSLACSHLTPAPSRAPTVPLATRSTPPPIARPTHTLFLALAVRHTARQAEPRPVLLGAGGGGACASLLAVGSHPEDRN